jgi:hypothetical protein
MDAWENTLYDRIVASGATPINLSIQVSVTENIGGEVSYESVFPAKIPATWVPCPT